MSVEYDNESGMEFDFDEKALIEKLLAEVVHNLACRYAAGVSVRVVGEEEIRALNREFREIDRATDVLSFPMNEFDEAGVFEGTAFESSQTFDPETKELMLGDIVLSAERVRSQAAEYGHSELREYAFLVTHSLLHLCGYDHINDSDRIRMEEKQREILNSLSINR